MKEQAEFARRLGDGEEDGYDAVVVGSGYGGSVAACRMSMAGIKVCLIEKGRRWEAHDFPTDSLKIMSAVRMENHNLGVSFGPKDALFQVHEQNDSLAVVACGIGGGSLVNAGVMVPTPVRARRNTKWPNEWERDWDICGASAAAMLGIQRVPVKFPAAKVLGELTDGEIEKSFETSMKLSVNFALEEPVSNSMKSQKMGPCLACGNCLSGCPYNAKSSTDKNYLLSAIQAGCDVTTECQVHYVVKNPYENFQECRISKKRRRWHVYMNEIDYITADFVVLSAGVFGTTEILFQSQMRGLKLSDSLGSGFSCNGNTVAYLAGSPAPLSSYGLNRKQLSKIPFQERPGPSISSSYTYSSGFTIQEGGGNLEAAIEQLLNVEKQMRLAGDVAGTKKVVTDILLLCFEARAWTILNDLIVLLSKRRGQIKQGEVICQFFIWAYILQLVEKNIVTREKALWKREHDLLLREYELQKRKDKLIERENALHKQEDEVRKLIVENRYARILLCMYWVLAIVVVFCRFGL